MVLGPILTRTEFDMTAHPYHLTRGLILFKYVALQYCDEDAFPNIYVLLVIACTLPVTTCETERRSNSQLKLLKIYLSSTMMEERLSTLTVIKVNRSMVEDLNFDQVTFANKHPRKMALPYLLSE